MRVIKSARILNKIIRDLKGQGKQISLVPTMGYLHEGHLSLVRIAKRKSDIVVVSIFVNPTQFGPKEDLARYPRDLKRDCKMLKKVRADFVFVPRVTDLYPNGVKATVIPGPLARGLCGSKRPGHFKGVVTVVKRLFEIAEPDLAIFGQKDFQQAKVIQDMIRRFHLNVRFQMAPIVREKDGLAMSSRNVYLSKEDRAKALRISASLRLARKLIRSGERNSNRIRKQLRSYLRSAVDRIDYIQLVDSKNLRPKQYIVGEVAILIACFIGRTRLIDNLLIQV